MFALPDEYNTHFTHFQPFFSKRVWKLALILLVGAMLTPRKRIVTAVLRIKGLSPGGALSELSSSVEPGGMVAPCAELGLDGLAGEHLFAHWASGDRHG